MKTLSTFSALVFSAVNIHMWIQIMLTVKNFLTKRTWIHLSSVCLFMTNQMSFPCKSFVTHCTQIRSWLVIMWTVSDIIAISSNLHLNTTFTCIPYTAWNIVPCLQFYKSNAKFHYKVPIKTVIWNDWGICPQPCCLWHLPNKIHIQCWSVVGKKLYSISLGMSSSDLQHAFATIG